jgi:UDP-2,3-diacylglucosamine pyrophosphatase LpxH
MNGTIAKAVIISDVHYSLSTYLLADKAFRMAIDTAAEYKVPLIDCGDLTNDKDVLRGTVINTIIKTMEYAADKGVRVYNLVGNHSLVNEKGDEHVLHFLKPYTTVISHPTTVDGFNFIPYQNSSEKVVEALNKFPKGSLVFMHQGVKGAWMGDYIQDRTSADKNIFADYRVISGHYHRADTIKCGRPRKGAVGLFSYVGNPYSLSHGEASDGPKGFQVLYSDGTLQQIPTNLRKHVVLKTTTKELELYDFGSTEFYLPGDIIRLTVTGPASELDRLNKKELGMRLFNTNQYKLDKIPSEVTRLDEKVEKYTDLEIVDRLIDKGQEPAAEKANLKALTRELLSETR